jgi:hypothetical protein
MVVVVEVEVVVEDNNHLLLPKINELYERDQNEGEKNFTCRSIEACSLGLPVPALHSYRPASP